jgi:hypothetical protein
VVVELLPVTRLAAKDSAGANRKLQSLAPLKPPALTTDDKENIGSLMHTVFVKLEVKCPFTSKQFFVRRSDFGPAAPDTAQRIIHSGLRVTTPIRLHGR